MVHYRDGILSCSLWGFASALIKRASESGVHLGEWMRGIREATQESIQMKQQQGRLGHENREEVFKDT